MTAPSPTGPMPVINTVSPPWLTTTLMILPSRTLVPAGGLCYLAPDPANMAIYSAYVLYCSFCRESYNQGSTGQLLYVFNLGGRTPQDVLVFNPPLASVVPVSAGTYSYVDFWFTDDQANLLTLNNFDASVNINLILAKMKLDGSV